MTSKTVKLIKFVGIERQRDSLIIANIVSSYT